MERGVQVRFTETGLAGVTTTSSAHYAYSGDLGEMVQVRFVDGLTAWVSTNHLTVIS